MRRLGSFWPDAYLEVITNAPSLLKILYPHVQAINPNTLIRVHGRFERYMPFLPRSLWQFMFELGEELRHRRYWKDNSMVEDFHSTTEKYNELSGLFLLNDSEKEKLKMAISQFDLFVASGGGYMTDSDKPMLWRVFDRLEAAIAKGVPTVMIGQGIGPIKDPQLLARARAILPFVGLILYRNRRIGFPLLESLSVPPDRIMFTGDDAIEMTYNQHKNQLGRGIGVSLRVAHYTQVDANHFGTLRASLQASAKKYNALLVAIPISSYYQESDITQIDKILDGYDKRLSSWRKFETPLTMIRKAGKCRVMVTGTYHGAIFALGQGIPVIGIAKSDEYFDKLSELSDEFSPGVQVLRLGTKLFHEHLTESIDHAWSSAELLRPQLLEMAKQQIDMGYDAYQKIFSLVESRKHR
jgi:colanic acid/amylovoran biosynthesis protein